MVRLVHPFPSVLDGLVVTGVALLAGGAPDVAARLGLSMTAIQCSIGALNDVCDAAADAGRVPAKPIPAGLVSRSLARWVVAAGAVIGVVLAASVSAMVVGLGAVVLLIGYAYDLFAKGTAWSWLPFAVGIPILPLYGWFGSVGSVPSFFAVLVPMAMLAGAALAIANARADLEHDREQGTVSVATSLGLDVAWRVHAVLWVTVIAVAVGWLIGARAPILGLGAVLAAGVVLAGAVLVGRGGDPARRRRAWELEAVAVSVALLVWLISLLA